MAQLLRNYYLEANLALYYDQVTDRLRNLRQYLSSGKDIAIIGSLNTTNVGDRAIALSLVEEMKTWLYVHPDSFGLHTNKLATYKLALQAGGDSIHDHYSTRQLERLLSISKSTSLGLVGVGVPGIFSSDGRRLLQELIEQVEIVTVRDQLSYTRLCEALPSNLHFKVHTTSDPAFLLAGNVPHRQRKSGLIGVSSRPLLISRWVQKKYGWTQSYAEQLQQNYIMNIRHTIDATVKDGYNLVFIPFVAEDLKFYRDNLADLKIRCLRLNTNPNTVIDTISQVEAMICTRYHSVIFSLITLTPFHVISYADKTDELVRTMPKISFTDRWRGFEYIEPNFSLDLTYIRQSANKFQVAARLNVDMIVNTWNSLNNAS